MDSRIDSKTGSADLIYFDKNASSAVAQQRGTEASPDVTGDLRW